MKTTQKSSPAINGNPVPYTRPKTGAQTTALKKTALKRIKLFQQLANEKGLQPAELAIINTYSHLLIGLS